MTKLVVNLLTFMIILTQAWSSADTKNTSTSGLRGFIANVGQWPSHVLYAVRQNGANVWITRTGVVTDQYSVSENGIRLGTVTREAFREVNPRFERSDGEPVSYVTFIKGSDSLQWLTAPVVSRASLVDYYPGVTFTFSLTAEGKVQRNIIVHQGLTFRRSATRSSGMHATNLPTSPPQPRWCTDPTLVVMEMMTSQVWSISTMARLLLSAVPESLMFLLLPEDTVHQ